MPKKPSWHSKNPAVAQVDSSGVVTGVAPGSTTVTASTDGIATDVPVAVPGSTSEPVFNPATDKLILQENFTKYPSAQEYFDHRNDGGPGVFHITSAAPESGANGQTTADGSFVTGPGGVGFAWRLPFAGTYQENHYLFVCGTQEDNAHPIDLNDGFSPNHGLLVTEWWARVIMSIPLGQSDGWRIKYFMMFQREPTNRGGGYATRLQTNTADQPVALNAGSLWQALQGVYDSDTEVQAVEPTATDTVNAGQWYRNKVAYQPNTAVGKQDGICRMWINGVKIVDISKAAIGITPPNGAKPWCTAADVDTLGLNNNADGTNQFVGPLRWWDILTTTNSPFTCDTAEIVVFGTARTT